MFVNVAIEVGLNYAICKRKADRAAELEEEKLKGVMLPQDDSRFSSVHVNIAPMASPALVSGKGKEGFEFPGSSSKKNPAEQLI